MWEGTPAHQRAPLGRVLEILARDYRNGGSTRRLLLSPDLSSAQRLEHLERILGPGLAQLAAALVLLAGRGRAHLLPAVTDAYGQFVGGKPRVRVTTALPLDVPTARILEEAVARAAPGTPVEYAEDPGLLAGAVVRVGDWTWDGSARGRLQKLEALLRSKVGDEAGL